MDLNFAIYCSMYVAAILICRGLGPIFFFPMIADLGFDLLLKSGGLSHWDIRYVIMAYGLLWFLWALVISRTLNRGVILLLLIVDFSSIFQGLLPHLTAVGAGTMFWHATATNIIEIWMLSTAVVIGAVLFKSTIVAKFRNEFVDVLTNPRKRFLIPMGLHSLWWVLPNYLYDVMPSYLLSHRYIIGSYILLGGWLALELPFYIKYRRLKKEYA